jgi:cytochrome c peroxidase
MNNRLRTGLYTCLAMAALSACAADTADSTESSADPMPQVQSPSTLQRQAAAIFGALPSVVVSPTRPLTDAKINLGRTLYYDSRLSRGKDLSCSSCHDLAHYGVDTRAEARMRGTSFGYEGQFGGRNAPTVYNAALHITQFWDGRAADVEAQAKGPILNPIEMNMPDEASVLAVVNAIPGYAKLFKDAFPDAAQPVTYDNLAAAIGGFERVLVTPGPFDAFLRGDEVALTSEQLTGLEVFIQQGCAGCHSGPLLGGHSYQKLGVAQPFETDDEGRAGVTGDSADEFFFKVPSLRNIAMTGPYFHDGSIRTLPEAVRLMAKHQSAAMLTDTQTAQIVSFLHALTGTIPHQLIQPPALPPSPKELPPAITPAPITPAPTPPSAASAARWRRGMAVYLDAGHGNWHSAAEMASRLTRAGVAEARGFSLNVSNFNVTEREVAYGRDISARIGKRPFIVDTSRNGLGSDGNWCNPKDRALGTPATASTGHADVDALFWIKRPGESDGACNGEPNAGDWWPEYALGLAQRARF